MRFLNKSTLTKFLIFCFLFWVLTGLLGSSIATQAHPRVIPNASQYFLQSVVNEEVMSFDRVRTRGWLLPNSKTKKSVILLNGIGANRLGLVSRAQFYWNLGYNVILPDLRGTGASDGSVITFGWKERYDLLAWVELLEKRGMESIAVHGLSLGAATIIYSFQEKVDYDFVVLESCYDNITNALNNRVDHLPIPSFLFFPLTKFTELRVEADESQLRPEDYIHLCKAPVFIMAGDSERKVKKGETEKLFNNVKSITKELHFFEGAYHENFMNRFQKEWEEEMLNWLDKI